MVKYIVVTGGVLSGLGKGIAAASVGHLLSKSKKVVPIKCDGYLNVDPGTMNPTEHGEVFVLDDGGEVDMDFGHYERFIGCKTKSFWNLTMGKVFEKVMKKERRGDYLGKTVQFIPHVVEAIKDHFEKVVEIENPDVLLIEIGGTVGDIENELYVEAVRQLKREKFNDVLNIHLTYVPLLPGVGEQKSKPTQQSATLLKQRGLRPDIVIARCNDWLTEKIRKKIALWADVNDDAVLTGKDTSNIYEIPSMFEKQGILKRINEKFGWDLSQNPEWENFVKNINSPFGEIKVALCGKYTELRDSYASVIEALTHAGAHNDVRVKIKWIETTDLEKDGELLKSSLQDVRGVIVPGGFGHRGIEGKIAVIGHCRENKIPYLGLCYGMQLAVIEFARNVCGLLGANSTEVVPNCEHPVVDLLPEQKEIEEKGGTMRLGGHEVKILEGSRAFNLFGSSVRLRFRHRYEINPSYTEQLSSKGIVFSGTTPSGNIVQIVELPNHPFFMATQAHPELTSSLSKPDKFFLNFVKACLG